MNSLDSLATFAPALSHDQVSNVDGGLVPLIIGLAFLNGVIWGAVVVDASR